MSEEKNKLVEIVAETGVMNPQAELIISRFKPLLQDAKKLIDESKDLVVTDPSQKDEMKKARDNRLALRDIRVAADKARKELKEDTIKFGTAVQGVYNLIKDAIAPIEEHLENQEKYIERIETERKARVEAERGAELSKYVEDISLYNFKEMSDEAFLKLVENLKAESDRKKEIEAKKLEEIKKQQELEQVFKDRTLALATYSFFMGETHKKLTIETTEEEFQSVLSSLKKIKADYDKEQKEIAIELEKTKAEQKRKDEEHAKELEKERAEKKKLEDEAAKKAEEERLAREAAAKAEQERIEKERQASLAPEKDKLTAYAESIRTIKAPADLSKAGLEIVKEVEQKLLAISQEIKIKIKTL